MNSKGAVSTTFLMLAILIGAALGLGLVLYLGNAEPGNPPAETPREEAQPDTTPAPVTTRIVAKPAVNDQGSPTPVGARGVATEVAGFVRDASGNAISDATVQIIDYRYDSASTKRLTERFTTDILKETVTSKDGRYVFQDLTPGGRHYLRASAPGYLTQFKDHVGVGMLADFGLLPGVRVHGKIVDDKTGGPVAGAMVKGWFRTPNVTDVNKLFRWEERQVTNETGDFVFEGAPAETVKFIIQHDDYEDLMQDEKLTPGDVNRITLKARRGLLIHGIVKDKLTGKPVGNAKVAITAMLVPRLETRTDESGAFVLRGVERGRQLVVLGADGYTDTRENRQFSDPDSFDPQQKNVHNFFIDPAGSIAGRVVTREGTPVDNARVFVGRKTPLTKVIRGVAEAVTGSEGRFLVRNIGANETVVLAVVKDGNAITVSPEVTLGPAEMKDGFDIQLASGASISGLISDELSTPVAGAVVTVEVPPLADVWFPPGLGMGAQRTETIVTGADGRYSIENLWTGTFTFHITHPEHVALNQQKVELRDAGQVLTKDFTIKIGRFIEGRVTEADGKPATGAVISAALPFTDTVAGTVKADADGHYRLAGLVRGNYRVQARRDGFSSRGVENIPSDSSGIDFVLQELGSVIGTVLGPDGQPVQGYTTELVPLDVAPENQLAMGRGASAGDTEQDDGGRFHVADVDPGNYNLVIRAHQFERWMQPNVTVTPGAPTDVGTIRLGRGASIRGKVTDARNYPVTEATLHFYNATLAASARPAVTKPREGIQGNFDPTKLPGAEQTSWSARVDAQGEYSVGGLPPGDYTVRIESDRYVPPEAETVRVERESETVRDYKLATACSAIITVRDNFNEPVAAMTASVRDAATGKLAGKRGMSPRSDIKGEIRLEGLAPGKYKISLQRAGYMHLEFDMDLMETQVVQRSVVSQKVN